MIWGLLVSDTAYQKTALFMAPRMKLLWHNFKVLWRNFEGIIWRKFILHKFEGVFGIILKELFGASLLEFIGASFKFFGTSLKEFFGSSLKEF